jgi:Mg-chelatase subunit ChlI
MMNFKKRPDMAQAVTVGEPTLVDARQTNATEVVKEIINAAGAAEGTKKVTAETIKDGKPGENQPVPRSDSEESESPSLDSPPPAPAPTNDASVDNGTAQESSSDQDKKEESSSKKKKKKGFRKLIPF